MFMVEIKWRTKVHDSGEKLQFVAYLFAAYYSKLIAVKAEARRQQLRHDRDIAYYGSAGPR